MTKISSGCINILVLGDSVGAPLGGGFDTYLDLLCKERFDRRVVLHNASGVGMTSADALIHLRNRLEEEKPDAVILHLGNCDACGYGFIKPRTLFWRKGKASIKATGKYRRENAMGVRQKPFAYKDLGLGAGLRRCVSAKDFGGFHSEMVNLCISYDVAVLVLNGRSKSDFIPCLNTGNFLSFKAFGVNDALCMYSGDGAIPLLDALSAHAGGNGEKALALYLKMAGDLGSEAGRAAANNAAAIYYDRAEYEKAGEMLAGIPDDFAMFPLVLFNRGILCLALGDIAQAEGCFTRAREEDVGSFRLADAFREALDAVVGNLAGKNGGVEFVDLAASLGNEHFLDYCHPTKDGHAAIWGTLRDRLLGMLGISSGEHKPEMLYEPLNPDRYSGFETDFFEHYGVVVTSSNEFCRTLVQEAGQVPYDEILERDVGFEADAERRKRLAILSHPLFGLGTFLAESPPKTRTDQGRVPELYFMRHMMPVYRVAEESGVPEKLFLGAQDMLMRTAKLTTWLSSLRLEAFVPSLDRLRQVFGMLDAGEILQRARLLLGRHLASEPSLFDRYRTITYYFFRESFVFGTPSHHSLFYQRMDIYRLMDTCLCGVLLAGEQSVQQEFTRLGELISQTVRLHQKHLESSAKRIFLMDEEALSAYAAELGDMQDRLFAW